MSEVLNDIDAILQAAAVRIVNPKNASILLTPVPAMFHLSAAGVPDVAEVTVTATLLGLEGDVTFSADGAALTNVSGKSAVVRLVDMQGPTAIVRAQMMAGGEQFTGTCIIGTLTDGASGGTAKMIVLTPSEQVFKISKTGANAPASITLTATGQNLGGTPSFTIPAGTATLTAGANALQKILTFANMATDSVTVQVAQDGVADRVTIIKVREGVDGQPGADAIVGLLSNESVTLPASSAGVVSSYSGAVCTMSVYKGATDDSANWAYAFSPASAAASLTYTASGRAVTITGMAAGIDTAYVDITASKSGAASIIKRFTITKSKAGTSSTGTRGAGHYYASGTTWSDGAADAATPGSNVIDDQVTISNGTTYALTKKWDGAAWVAQGAVLDGSLFVTGSINGAALKAGTVDIRAPDGTVILSAGRPLAEQVSANPNLLPAVTTWDTPYAGASAGRNSQNTASGEYINLPANPGAGYIGLEQGLKLPQGGEWVTLSCKAQTITAGAVCVLDLYNGADIGGKISGHLQMSPPGVGVLTAYSTTFKLPPNIANVRVRAYLSSLDKGAQLGDVKLEIGQRVTAWSDDVITASNSGQYVMPNAITNTQIGGDLYSTNWNGITGPGGAGWMLQRSGILYAHGVRLRGAVAGGAYTGFASPSANAGGGYYLGEEGLALGNYNAGQYFVIYNNGDVISPNFNIQGKNVRVKGAIEGSIIRTSVMAIESARLMTPWNRLAPFSIFDSGSVYNTSIRNATVTLTGFVGPAQGAENTFHPKRLASFRKDVFLKAFMNGDVSWENLYIDVQYHNSSEWYNLASTSVLCEGRASTCLMIRYTVWDSGWDYINFRARTSLGRTLALVFEVQAFNWNESVNGSGTSSGMPVGDSGGGGVGSNPEPWCVDYETTRLPDGRFVRNVAVNDLLACWDFDLANPGVEYAPVNKVAFGEEASTMLVTENGVQIIQSDSTPMTVRDNRVVLTPEMLGEEVVVKRGDTYAWEKVTHLFPMGVRRVVKVSLHDRMYFAGMDPKATIATHNIEYKP